MNPQVETGADMLLRLESVRFGWSRAHPLIDIGALALGRGEALFLAGPSGSGKSTLLSLVGGVVAPDAGRIHIGAHELTALSRTARDRLRADELGIIFQQFNLLPFLSVLDNVVLPCRFSAARRARLASRGVTPLEEAHRLLGRLGLAECARAGGAVTELSMGQQQRVAVARAMIGSPSIIIADEPTSALDADSREHFLALLFDECRASGAALLFVSHDERLAERFDRRLALGQINRAPAGGGR
ncbi:MAG: ABC transporter ATP-binding protein [Burkholderiaceae bacterium]